MSLSKRSWLKRWTSLPGYLVSVAVHGLLMLILLHLYLPESFRAFQELIFQPGLSEDSDVFEEFVRSSAVSVENLGFAVATQAAPGQTLPVFEVTPSQSAPLQANPWASVSTHIGAFGDPHVSAFSGRGDGKGALLALYGGSEGSEQAVALGLEWLAEHQNPNGSWSYDFTKSPKCRGKCNNPGPFASANSATALALLPFLGAGITPKSGDQQYRQVVDRGLKFLLQNGQRSREGLSFIDDDEGKMYHHGLAAIAICEAASMTQDATLKEAAQQAVNFICYAQIPADGGWRYEPRDRMGGNTSVFGWQIMALKSGQMGGAQVPSEVFFKAQRFLDTVVGIDQGAMYGYKSSGDLYEDTRSPDNRTRPWTEYRRATSAIGLLSQMHMGWNLDHPSLIRGVEYLSAKGPDPNNLYYNYYATQVMHHYGGEAWRRWNQEQRDTLIARQSLEGHERGSWYFDGPWNDVGGRLYTTSLAIMILEVYYRHLPLYQKQAVEAEFPLD